MLEEEIQLFSENQQKLQRENPTGGYVVIYKNKILGTWKDRYDALKAGLQEFGNIQFLVKSVHEQARTVNFTKQIQS